MYREKLYIFCDIKFSVFVRQTGTECNFSGKESWTILSPIEQSIKRKIEAVGTPLKDWNINIYRGILTGYNEAFIIDGNKRNKLIEEDPKSVEIIRPILRGRDIKRYGYEFVDLWLLFIPWHFPLHQDTTITGASNKAEQAFKSQYPAVYNHLLSYKKELGNRNKAETGIRYEWYALQRWGANYWDDFSKQKIVWGNLNLKASYTIAPEGFFVNAPCTMIVPASRYLLSVLNSKLADYYIRNLGVTRNGGYFEYKPMFVEQLPVPIIPKEEQNAISELVDASFSRRKDVDIHREENKIDEIIFKLYQLTSEEADFVRTL
ncbi:MAG: TaqI-like C-terminal specificity domain-containing protein [Bacteroidales bacterium]|nr:TaqI-like C-terminal specificity domain-containing protein [Bacteroidales bacterium]